MQRDLDQPLAREPGQWKDAARVPTATGRWVRAGQAAEGVEQVVAASVKLSNELVRG